MEGLGSRLGRTSSRYGGPAAAAVFNGRVRKWKKKWVHVSAPSTASFRSSQSNGRNSANGSSHILLCKWTPLSSSSTTAAAAAAAASEANGSDAAEEEPPKRRFRYTPVALLEEREKAAAKKEDDEAEIEEVRNRPEAASASSIIAELNMNLNADNEIPDSDTSHLDLGLCLK